jgi:alkyldihydroxyacetonephosphate synthase
MVKGYKPSVVRLYDKADVDHNYGSVKLKDEEAFMFFSCEGPADVTAVSGAAIHKICMEHGAEDIGTKAVDHWFIHRNDLCDYIGTEKERQRFRETGIAYATIEICADWEEIEKIYYDAMEYVPNKVPNLTMFGGHVSHSYINGTNIYFVYNIKMSSPETSDLEYWAVMDAVCDVVLKYPSATIAHHHGVGKARVLRIKEELGSSYVLMRTIKDSFDPKGIMNPGCLVPLEK